MSWCMVHNDSYRDLTYKDSTHQEKQEDLPHTLHTLSHSNEWYLWHSRAVTHNPSQTSCRPSHLTSLPIPLAQLSQLNKSRWCSGSWGPMGCLGSCQQRPCTIKMWHCTVYVLSTLFPYTTLFRSWRDPRHPIGPQEPEHHLYLLSWESWARDIGNHCGNCPM